MVWVSPAFSWTSCTYLEPVPLVQAGKGSFSAVTAVSEQGDKVFLIEIGRRGIGVLYIQVDLHLPEIVAVILGQRHGRNSPAGRLPWARQRRPPQGRLRRKAGRTPQSPSIRQPETFRKLRREILQDINILLSEIKQILPPFIIHDVQLEMHMILAMPQKLVNLL